MIIKQLEYERKLNSSDRQERIEAAEKLSKLMKSGEVAMVPEQSMVNLHAHTNYSYNAYGYSPSAMAWEAKKHGLYAMGIIDHEKLGGVEEFLQAGKTVCIRGVGGIETRVFIPEWKDMVVNMPGEYGVFGFLGCGFITGTPAKGSKAEKILNHMSELADKKLKMLAEQLNDYLGIIKIDLENDFTSVIPESGIITERHLLDLLENKACDLYPDMKKRADFWADALRITRKEVMSQIENPSDFKMLIRSKLMKQGSPCNIPMKANEYPELDQSADMMMEMGAVPVAGWLDGMNEGERDTLKFLDFMLSKKVPAISVIPERNYNISDRPTRQAKIKKLYEIVKEAVKREMFIVVGTDMSKSGQKFVDDFNSEVLKPLTGEFMKGAKIMAGHTRLRMYTGAGLLSAETTDKFCNINQRNSFFEEIGSLKVPVNEMEGRELESYIKEKWRKI